MDAFYFWESYFITYAQSSTFTLIEKDLTLKLICLLSIKGSHCLNPPLCLKQGLSAPSAAVQPTDIRYIWTQSPFIQRPRVKDVEKLCPVEPVLNMRLGAWDYVLLYVN